jgi:hypothetical protein
MVAHTNAAERSKNMFTITGKLRTIVTIGAVGAALASSGVASAASIGQWINPNKVGSAAQGVTNGDCENLANAVNTLNSAANHIGSSNPSLSSYYATAAAQAQNSLDRLCFQID